MIDKQELAEGIKEHMKELKKHNINHDILAREYSEGAVNIPFRYPQLSQ